MADNFVETKDFQRGGNFDILECQIIWKQNQKKAESFKIELSLKQNTL